MDNVCYHIEHPDAIVKGISCVASEVEQYSSDCIDEIISDCDLDIGVVCIYMHGSRIFGNPREDSDIDIVLFYEGPEKEDSLFNIFHDPDYENLLYYEGCNIDINPIRLYGDNIEEQIQRYINKHDIDYLNESAKIIRINEANILNETIPYALADNPSGYYSAFSYEIMPLMTNLSQAGNDIGALNRNSSSFKFFVGDIVKGKCAIDDEIHKCQIIYLYFNDGEDTPKYVYGQEFKTKRIIPLYPNSLTKFKYINKEEPVRQVVDMIPQNPIIDI